MSSCSYLAPLWAGKDGVHIPETISEEAKGTLRFFNSVIQSSGKKIFDGAPEPDDRAGWASRFQDNEQYLLYLQSLEISQKASRPLLYNMGQKKC